MTGMMPAMTLAPADAHAAHYRNLATLDSGLEHVRSSPAEVGTVELIGWSGEAAGPREGGRTPRRS
jgi:hypothetical protein